MDERKHRRPFYSKFVWRDWDHDTKDLDPYEYTAYHRLLSFAASSPDLCSIPNDDRRLSRACGFTLKTFLRVRSRVMLYWWLRPDSRYEHGRLRRDADAWLQHCEEQRLRRTGGSTGGAPTESPDEHPTRSREKQEARSKKQAKIEEPKNTRSRSLAEREPDGFPEAYDTYPRKTARRAASKAYAAAMKRHPSMTTDDMSWAIAEYVQQVEKENLEPRFIPMPATWLNQDRFLEFFEEGDDETQEEPAI